MRRRRDTPCAGKEEAERQLRHCVGGRLRRVADFDSGRPRVIHADVVQTDACADDQLQPAPFGRVDFRLLHFGRGTHNYHVEIPDRVSYLTLLKVFFHHFMSASGQPLHRWFCKTIRRQYPHVRFLLNMTFCLACEMFFSANIVPYRSQKCLCFCYLSGNLSEICEYKSKLF